jgi:RNA polymerase sigma factor (sigma-70 family)
MTEQEFERLVREHQGVVCAVAYAVLRDRARSEEVAQDAFLLAWQRLPVMDPKPAMPAWVCGVARNLALNAARRRKETAMEAREAVVTETPLNIVLDRETEDLARAALGALSQRDREVVTLYYRNDASVAEISGALGLSEAAVKQRLHRGRERLRENLAAVETTLRATRPGPAFAAACVAALATRGSVAHAAPKVSLISTKIWIAIGVTALAALATTTIVVATSGRTATATPQTSIATPTMVERAAPTTTGLKRLAAGERAERLERFKSLRTARTAAAAAMTGSAGAPDKIYDFSGQRLDDTRAVAMPPRGTPLSKATLRYAIVQMRPLLAECYNAALDQLPHEPSTLDVALRLSGEPDYGTLVEDVTLTGPIAQNADLSECVRETLFALELPPMTEGGTWEVHYPFAVSGAVSQ